VDVCTSLLLWCASAAKSSACAKETSRACSATSTAIPLCLTSALPPSASLPVRSVEAQTVKLAPRLSITRLRPPLPISSPLSRSASVSAPVPIPIPIPVSKSITAPCLCLCLFLCPLAPPPATQDFLLLLALLYPQMHSSINACLVVLAVKETCTRRRNVRWCDCEGAMAGRSTHLEGLFALIDGGGVSTRLPIPVEKPRLDEPVQAGIVSLL